MSQYFQMSLGYGPLATGLRFLPWTATPLFIAPLAGALSDKLGPRPLMTLGLAMQAAGLAWVALLAGHTASYAEIVVPLVIAGVGISMAIPTMPLAVMGAVAPPDMGTASGVLNMLQRFGGVASTTGSVPPCSCRPACPSLALSLPSWPADPGPKPSTRPPAPNRKRPRSEQGLEVRGGDRRCGAGPAWGWRGGRGHAVGAGHRRGGHPQGTRGPRQRAGSASPPGPA
jgi:MFS family permease